MILYRTPGRSFTRPPRTSTIECSWRLWPMPGMYAVTSTPVVSRTRATFRSAEFGFFGVVVNTRVHTPRRWGEPFSAGVFDLSVLVSRPLRTSWAIVGTALLAVGVDTTRIGSPGRPRRAHRRVRDRSGRTNPERLGARRAVEQLIGRGTHPVREPRKGRTGRESANASELLPGGGAGGRLGGRVRGRVRDRVRHHAQAAARRRERVGGHARHEDG